MPLGVSVPNTSEPKVEMSSLQEEATTSIKKIAPAMGNKFLIFIRSINCFGEILSQYFDKIVGEIILKLSSCKNLNMLGKNFPYYDILTLVYQ
jgi:hypothetical protein